MKAANDRYFSQRDSMRRHEQLKQIALGCLAGAVLVVALATMFSS